MPPSSSASSRHRVESFFFSRGQPSGRLLPQRVWAEKSKMETGSVLSTCFNWAKRAGLPQRETF